MYYSSCYILASGHDEAQFNLSLRYQNGDGAKADPVEAFRWMLHAAKKGEFLILSCLQS